MNSKEIPKSSTKKISSDSGSVQIGESIVPGVKLKHVLKGHTFAVYRMALSPDGRILASPSADGTVRLWDVESGQLLQTLEHGNPVVCSAWSPDGRIIASGGGHDDKKVHIWNFETGERIEVLKGHTDQIKNISWSSDGEMLASCSLDDKTIRLWRADTWRQFRTLEKHTDTVNVVAWSPDGRRLCSGSWDKTIRLWDAATGEKLQVLSGHSNYVDCVAWSPDGQSIASGSDDLTVRIWNAETGRQTYSLEGHTDWVVSVCFMDEGRLLASLGGSTVIIWRTDTWTEVAHIDKIGNIGGLSNIAFHPTLPVMAVHGASDEEINIWELDFDLLLGAPAEPAIHYVNAKAVLLGESGVGKSGLGICIAEGEFRMTESTHGAQFWHFPTERLVGLPSNVQAELTLWDLAGQPEYRLVHQLFLDDTDAALLLFDCSDPSEPFRGVPYWAKVLKKHAPPHAVKFLVSARCDVSPVTVDKNQINLALVQYGLDKYFKTTARKMEGVQELFKELLAGIPWEKLPRTSRPRLFQVIREFLLERKKAEETLITMDEIRSESGRRFKERIVTQGEIDTVIALLQSNGMVYRLDPKPDQTFVLLRPELINQYASSIIIAARNHPLGIGSVPERDVLTGSIAFSGERLPHDQESIVLEATAELLIQHDLCFREMGFLVFPSQINVTRPVPPESHPRTEVAYRFSGSIETIYASLVVRLNYTNHFRREDQWKYAVEFSRKGQRLGFSMTQIEEGTGELEIYFQPGIIDFDRVTFIRFVTDHLRAKGIDIKEEIRLYCPNCEKEVTDRNAIESRINEGHLDIPCQYCDTKVMIPRSIEEHYQRNNSLAKKQQELVKTVERRTEQEVKQFRDDQQQYTQEADNIIQILHLSDIHLENKEQAQIYRTQLETDLIDELKIKRLEYLVISGDVVNHSTEEEYQSAFDMFNGLVNRFGMDSSRVVIVPGNHDLNWELSETAYPFVPKRKLPASLPEGKYISAGDAGVLLRNDELYKQRFAHFNSQFYKRIYSKEYPLEYAEQTLFVERPDDRVLFLGLSSCWQVDHHFYGRAGVNMEAFTKAIDRLHDGKYDGWLKIAVWHHPVTGQEMMNDEFMQLLAVNKFQVCLHGHIHEAIECYHKYDDERGIHIVGAGTFGAPTRDQVTGIPLQYNLLAFDPDKAEITVYTRKKEKVNGAWSADARWGKKEPKAYYSFSV